MQRILKTFGLFLVLFFAAVNAWAAEGLVSTPSHLYFPPVNTVDGNPNGKITLVEFFDYNCGYCHKVPGIFHQLVKSNPNVRIVYRDYPVLGPESTYAARAAVAAAAQGKYSEFHNALFKTRKPLSDENVHQIALSAGVDTARLAKDIESRSVGQYLKTNAQAASRLQLEGVPVVLVAVTPDKDQKSVKAFILTAPTYAELQDAINKLGAIG